jgi:cellulose biosynthesis protein BcsQ
VPAPEGGYELVPANQDLTVAEVELLDRERREYCLSEALAPVMARYDYVLIDCPPAINMLTVNALTASDHVLIPMQCEYYALEGLSALINTVEQIRDSANPRLGIHGILRTMFDPRNNLANEVSSQLISHFGDRVYRTVIPRNIRLAEAPSFGRRCCFTTNTPAAPWHTSRSPVRSIDAKVPARRRAESPGSWKEPTDGQAQESGARPRCPAELQPPAGARGCCGREQPQGAACRSAVARPFSAAYRHA